jgi:signal transduction histidine kinase
MGGVAQGVGTALFEELRYDEPGQPLFVQAARIEVELRTSGPLPASVETLLGLAAREGTTNVIRHSGASRCRVEVRRTGGVAELEIRDDGADRAARRARTGRGSPSSCRSATAACPRRRSPSSGRGEVPSLAANSAS